MVIKKTDRERKKSNTKAEEIMVDSNKEFKKTGGFKFSSFSRRTKLSLGILIGAVLIAFILYSFRGVYLAAMVNGKPVYRLNVVKELEKRAGGQTLDFLVTKMIIEQEAVKKGVKVNDDEVNSELKKYEDEVEKQGQKLEDVTGMSRSDLAEQIRLKKLIDKMVGGNIKVTDEEINKYMEENKDFLPTDTSEDELKKSVKERLIQQKLDQKLEGWLADLKSKSKINYFVSY